MCGIVCRGEFLCSFEGTGELNETGARREIIPLLWRTVRETALAKRLSFNVGDKKYPSVCGRTKLPGRCVQSNEIERQAGDESEMF